MRFRVRFSACLLASVLFAACTSGNAGRNQIGRIPQPIVSGIPVAPDSARVDLTVPTFSHPTHVTNPLFPVSRQLSVLFVGHVEGKPFRTEVTLLPYTRIIEWEGHRTETLVSQYVAYLDGRLQEVAYDKYAQADDGSVWYFGEDVVDVEHGAIVSSEGTWIAGKDGPPAMIMPAHPKVGDAFRTENIPGIAFEEVTVKAVDRTLRGPLGPIPGGLVGRELHMDGKHEGKLFAPGYGEFYTADGPDVEALALAVPTDAAHSPLPADLRAMADGALRVFDAVSSKDWPAASAASRSAAAAWDRYRTGDVPRLLRPVIARAVRSLSGTVRARDPARAGQAAIDAARWSFDLQLPYRAPVEINLERFDLWAAQVLVDAAARDLQSVRGDVFTLEYIRDRIQRALDPVQMNEVNLRLENLWTAEADGHFGAVVRAAHGLRATLAARLAASR